MHCINTWAGSSLACCNVFWHVAVLTSSFSPVLSGGEVLAYFFICNVHDEKIPILSRLLILFYFFDLSCILQAILVNTLVSALHGPHGGLLCANARKTPRKVKMYMATNN